MTAMRAATVTMATTDQVSRRRGQVHQVRSVGTGEKFCKRGGSEGESADESARWIGTDSDGTATDEYAMTVEGAGWDGEPRTATAGGVLESGADRRSGDAMADGGQHQESLLHGCREGRSGGTPWGDAGAKGEV